MITPKQLETCNMCQFQKYDTNDNSICGLTNESPKFEFQCDTFEYDLNKNAAKTQNANANHSDGFTWKTLLSILLAIIAVVRLLNTCSKM